MRVLSLSPQPERILGDEYSIRSELWSLGVSLLEVSWEATLLDGFILVICKGLYPSVWQKALVDKETITFHFVKT